MDRMVLRDDQWKRIARLVPGKVGDPGRSGADNRLFVEAVLWIVRVGAPWRDLPKDFGNWNSVFQRFCCAALRVVGGSEAACLISFSKPCRRMPTSNTSSSMAPSSGCTSTVVAHEEGPGRRPSGVP